MRNIILTSNKTEKHTRSHFWQLGTLWVSQIVVEIGGIRSYFFQALAMFVQNMLAHELGALEFLPTERAKPFVFGQFLKSKTHYNK